MKKCSKCLELKDFSEFSKDKQKKDGLRSSCKYCMSKSAKTYYTQNKTKLKSKTKEYHENHKEERQIKKKIYNKQNKEKLNKLSREYYYQNKDKFKTYYENNKEYINKRVTGYKIERYKKDIDFRLRSILRGRLKDALKGNFKKGSAIRDLGCSIEELKVYLESKFQEGMTWENYGFYGWHIDHIKPLSSFDLTDENQLKEAVHYTNLQPLWAEDNLKKGNKILTTYIDNATTPTVSSDINSEAANEDCQILTSEVDHV